MNLIRDVAWLVRTGSRYFKWNFRGSHAADLIAGSAAKCASSGVRSARLEWGCFRLYRSMYSPMGTQGMADRLVRFPLDLFVLDAAPNPLDEHVIAPASLPSIGSPMPRSSTAR